MSFECLQPWFMPCCIFAAWT